MIESVGGWSWLGAKGSPHTAEQQEIEREIEIALS